MKDLKSNKSNYFKIQKFYISILLISFIPLISFSQQNYGILVNNTWLSVQNEAGILIPGDLINATGTGSIKLDGIINMGGDITNDASNNLFEQQQTVAIGKLIMSSNSFPQHIKGQGNPIYFPNLEIISSKKVLLMADCRVNNKFTIDAELDLNRKNFIINNQNSDAIIYNSGFIRSESQPPIYGTFQWNVLNNTGTFKIPFGNGMNYTKNLELSLIIETSGSVEGSYTMATYPTDNFTNIPYPSSVISLLPYQDVNMVDRFWYVSPNFVSRPNISLEFTCDPRELDSPNSIDPKKLTAIRYNDFQFKWNDWQPGNAVPYNPQNSKLLTNSIPRQHQFSHWALVSEDVTGDIWIPNAFTPDRDEYYKNEDFGPVITFPYAKYEFYVYNRWGQLIFQSDDVNNRWDGTFLGEVVPQGTYAWLIIITKHSTKKYKYNGIVNVVL